MQGLRFGLGQFGDRRLEKGGSSCMRRWSHDQDRAFGDWAREAWPRFNDAVLDEAGV